MELEITAFMDEADPSEFSGSIMERGPDAGPETWRNAMGEAARQPLLTTPAQLDELRDYARGFGAWEDEEIDAWTPQECNAWLVQYISGDIREAEALCPGEGPGGIDWTKYQRLAERGTLSGNLYLGGGNRVFVYIGN